MDQKEISNKIDSAYQRAVHTAYAVVLGLTFSATWAASGSPMDFIFSGESWLKILPIALGYSIFVSSWIGYVRSIAKNGYRLEFIGTIRFLIDLFVGFLYYVLLKSVSSDKGIDYENMFFLLPIIFTVYSIWDILKYHENKNSEIHSQKSRFRRFAITVSYLILFGIMFMAYEALPLFITLWNFTTPLDWFYVIDWESQMLNKNDVIWNSIFVIVAIVINAFYRKAKWKDEYNKPL